MSRKAEWLSIDFETCSTTDLRRAGVAKYVEDPNTDIICLSYALDNEPPRIWHPGLPFPSDVMEHVFCRRRVRAWNAVFEWYVWLRTLLKLVPERPYLSMEQLYCTMAQGAYWGTPLSLEQAAEALQRPIRKDMVGRRLILQCSRPRKIDPDGTIHWWHKEDPEKFKRVQLACQNDVDTERGIAKYLKPLPPKEREIWLMDQEINATGMKVDLDLVSRMQHLSRTEKSRLDSELSGLTGGEVTSANQTAKLLGWVNKLSPYNNKPIPDLQKGTVKAWIGYLGKQVADTKYADPAKEKALRALQIRAEAAKTSTAKLNAMTAAACQDGVLRGLLQYYGAFRTGRWAGRLVQPQNFTRPTVPAVQDAIEYIKSAPNGNPDPKFLEVFFGAPMDVIASCLRGCLVARDGYVLMVFDYAQIEARVLAWLAGQDDILAVFRRGDDVYVFAANKIGSTDRMLGKVTTLACGYGMGPPRFRETAKDYGLILSQADSIIAVKNWRDANPEIVNYWYHCQRTCIRVVENRITKPQDLDDRGTQAAMWSGHLLIKLPSGRTLIYRNPRVETDSEGRIRLTYMGLNQYTRKWERIDTWGGKIVENITQAVARDIMADGMLRTRKYGWVRVLLSVHDEIIFETRLGSPVHFQTIKTELSETPGWADEELPIGCDGWIGPRYRKG